MTALDPELSDEARAVKIRWFEKVLERLLKLQSRIASSATKQCTASNVRQCATSSFTPSTFLLRNNPCCAAFFSDATCLNADCTASSSWISCCMEKQVHWGKIDGSATILEFLHRGDWCTKKSLWTLLMKTKRMLAERSGRAMQPVCRDEKVFPTILWMCGQQQAFGWLRISRPSSDLWRCIGTTTKTNSTLG